VIVMRDTRIHLYPVESAVSRTIIPIHGCRTLLRGGTKLQLGCKPSSNPVGRLSLSVAVATDPGPIVQGP
jgi:hypothetical protein